MSNGSKSPTESSSWLTRFFQRLKQLLFGAPPQPGDPEADRFAHRMLKDVAKELAKKLNVSESDLYSALCACHQGKNSPITLSGSLRVECTLSKLSASQIKSCIQVLHQSAGKADLTTIKQRFAWDKLPRELRSEFIKSGQKEIHYVLCELQHENDKSPNQSSP